MAEFFADMAGVLELFAIAAGFVLLHRAGKEAPARLLRVAGFVLVIGGIAIGLCTTYYWFQYRARGDFQTAHMMYPGAMTPGVIAPGTMMGPGTQGAMPRSTMPPAVTPPDTR
jgi:hypothetical protein